jgi:hypothetical protein
MKFKTENNNIVYCKNYSYQKKFDNTHWYDSHGILYYKGRLVHRDHGPAIEYAFGDKEWYLNGKCYSEKEYLNIINLKKKSDVLNEI